MPRGLSTFLKDGLRHTIGQYRSKIEWITELRGCDYLAYNQKCYGNRSLSRRSIAVSEQT